MNMILINQIMHQYTFMYLSSMMAKGMGKKRKSQLGEVPFSWQKGNFPWLILKRTSGLISLACEYNLSLQVEKKIRIVKGKEKEWGYWSFISFEATYLCGSGTENSLLKMGGWNLKHVTCVWKLWVYCTELCSKIQWYLCFDILVSLPAWKAQKKKKEEEINRGKLNNSWMNDRLFQYPFLVFPITSDEWRQLYNCSIIHMHQLCLLIKKVLHWFFYYNDIQDGKN